MDKTEEFLAALKKDVLESTEENFGKDSMLDPWDSLAVMSCIALIDEVYGKQVSGRALLACNTAGDILKLVTA